VGGSPHNPTLLDRSLDTSKSLSNTPALTHSGHQGTELARGQQPGVITCETCLVMHHSSSLIHISQPHNSLVTKGLISRSTKLSRATTGLVTKGLISSSTKLSRATDSLISARRHQSTLHNSITSGGVRKGEGTAEISHLADKFSLLVKPGIEGGVDSVHATIRHQVIELGYEEAPPTHDASTVVRQCLHSHLAGELVGVELQKTRSVIGNLKISDTADEILATNRLPVLGGGQHSAEGYNKPQRLQQHPHLEEASTLQPHDSCPEEKVGLVGLELLGLHNQLGLVSWQVGTTSPVTVGVPSPVDVRLPEQMIHQELVNPEQNQA
jgi:hypothetical protein